MTHVLEHAALLSTLNRVYPAVTTSPAWSRTVLVINYDEWGGFFDHVPPPLAPIPQADQDAGNQDGRLGVRTPCIVVSPFAERRFISHLTLDHTSVLRMIEWRWGLRPLTIRDQTARNLAQLLNFAEPDLDAKQFNVPIGPFGGSCATPLSPDTEWLPLLQMARDFGWQI